MVDIALLEAMKTGDKYRDYCIDDAIFHVKKATEALVEGLSDPEAWYSTSQAAAKVLAKMLPLIIALQIAESQEPPRQKSAESSPEGPEEARSF